MPPLFGLDSFKLDSFKLDSFKLERLEPADPFEYLRRLSACVVLRFRYA